MDSADGFYQGVQALMTYTAKNQLYFSMTPTVQVGTYDYNWHWYDGQGMRVISNVSSGSQYIPGDDPDPDVGTRSYYVYDGSDVQMMLSRTGGTWRVQQRLLTGGIDQVLAGRFTNLQGTKRGLALVSDRQGTTLAAMRADGSQETQAIYFPRSPWGRQEGASGGGGNINTQTGYTGAGTPNQTGGFTYLRNRWYDPQTGRFLTQDPIGLAGGVNLYAYAADNPVAFGDPFGLCPPCPDDEEQETTGQMIRRAAEAWVADKIDDAIEIFGSAKDWLKENGPRFLAEEIAATAIASQIPVVGQIRAGRRIAAIGRTAGRFLSESTHLRNARIGARHDWTKYGLSADDVVGTIARRSGWEASSGLVSGSLRMGDHVVDYRIFNRTTGEAIVNAWIRGAQ